jgi:hypothetical protein
MAVRLSALRAGRPLPPGRFLELIFLRGWVDPLAVGRLEGLDQFKKPTWPHQESNPRLDAIPFAVPSIDNQERRPNSHSSYLFVLPSIAAEGARISCFEHAATSCKEYSVYCTPFCPHCLNSVRRATVYLRCWLIHGCSSGFCLYTDLFT